MGTEWPLLHQADKVGIAIPGQFPNPGIRDWRGRDPGAQFTCH
jgi:hypothetical protein